jgi:hypothetical protein
LEDVERAAEAKLPPDTSYRSKTELALELTEQASAWDLPRQTVLTPNDHREANTVSAQRWTFATMLDCFPARPILGKHSVQSFLHKARTGSLN